MTGPEVAVRYVTLDVVDLDRAAAFWSALLGTPEEVDQPGYQLSVLADPEGIEFCIMSPDARPGRSAVSPAPRPEAGRAP